MPSPLTWWIFHIIVDCFLLIVFARVINQSHGHWLLNDALHFAILMN
jgi:hypothetical protein